MLRGVLAAGLTVSVVAGAGVVALRSVGEDARDTFDTLNQAFSDNASGEGEASAQEVSDWIERYRDGARGVRCRRAASGWDYVCFFRADGGRRLKVGVVVDSRQPRRMSPIVPVRRPLPPPNEGALGEE
jgi:hypothetical protein